jgi:hypothetical protein
VQERIGPTQISNKDRGRRGRRERDELWLIGISLKPFVEHELFGKPASTHQVKPAGMLCRIAL